MNVGIILTLIVLAFSLALILYMYHIGSQGRDPNPGETIPDKEEMKKFIVYGAFYHNPSDPRGWVPKIHCWGWTINFKSKSQVYFFLTLIFLDLMAAGFISLLACKFL